MIDISSCRGPFSVLLVLTSRGGQVRAKRPKLTNLSTFQLLYMLGNTLILDLSNKSYTWGLVTDADGQQLYIRVSSRGKSVAVSTKEPREFTIDLLKSTVI